MARRSSTSCSRSASGSNENLQQIIDEQTEPWGIKVTIVEIKDVEIPERMQHALARQAEAERNRRAKVINAEGEFQAADRLADAAEVIRPNPVTIQLRYLQALSEISANQGTTIVFPLPMDVLRPLIEGGTANGGESTERPKRAEQPAERANRPGTSSPRASRPSASSPRASPPRASRRRSQTGADLLPEAALLTASG